jgi:hypothetical protein
MPHLRRIAARGNWLVSIVLLMGFIMTGEPSAGKPPSIDAQKAQQIVQQELAKMKPGTEFVLLPDRTLTKDFGWVFFYTTRKHKETGDIKYAIPGTGPLVVLRANGHVHALPTSVPPSVAVQEFEKMWRDGKVN